MCWAIISETQTVRYLSSEIMTNVLFSSGAGRRHQQSFQDKPDRREMKTTKEENNEIRGRHRGRIMVE